MTSKYFLTISLYLIFFSSQAQFTLVQATHAPTIGAVSYSLYDSTTVVMPQSNGPNCKWDFKNIQLKAQNYLVKKYINPSGTPGFSEFKIANVAEDYGNGTYDFYKSSASNFERLGFYDGANPHYHLPPSYMYKWPINYGNSFIDSSTSACPGPCGYTVDESYTLSATGYGTLTLPGGRVYSNILKLHKLLLTLTEVENTSSVITRTFVSDFYFDQTERYPVLEVSFIYSGILGGGVNVSYQILVNEPILVGLTDSKENSEFSIQPNPANEKVRVNFSDKLVVDDIRIYNTEGKLVKELSNANKGEIPISDLTPGIYFVSVQTVNGRTTKKLIVQ